MNIRICSMMLFRVSRCCLAEESLKAGATANNPADDTGLLRSGSDYAEPATPAQVLFISRLAS